MFALLLSSALCFETYYLFLQFFKEKLRPWFLNYIVCNDLTIYNWTTLNFSSGTLHEKAMYLYIYRLFSAILERGHAWQTHDVEVWRSSGWSC